MPIIAMYYAAYLQAKAERVFDLILRRREREYPPAGDRHRTRDGLGDYLEGGAHDG